MVLDPPEDATVTQPHPRTIYLFFDSGWKFTFMERSVWPRLLLPPPALHLGMSTAFRRTQPSQALRRATEAFVIRGFCFFFLIILVLIRPSCP
ncbi:unnamed protein product [Lepidochelys olivacea]